MESTAIAEELRQLLREAEYECIIPVEWVQRFGKWDRLKELVQDMIDEVGYAQEEVETVQNDHHQLEEKLRDIEDEIDGILDKTIGYLDSDIVKEIADALEEVKNII